MSGSGRVVITGMGAVTCLGNSVPAIWKAILERKSGIGYIRQFDSCAFPVPIAGEVDLNNVIVPGLQEQFPGAGRAAHFGCWAADAAWEAAKFAKGAVDRSRAGVSIGASTFPVIEDRLSGIADLLDQNGWKNEKYLEFCRSRRWLLAQSDAASISGLLSRRLRIEGPSTTIQGACASSTQAIGHAYSLIREGRADVMLAGGTDSMVSMMCVAGFTLLGSLSRRWSDPTKASRPFDRTRDGFVLSEGAAMLVLESLDSALARGASIHGEVIGYGSSLDTYRFTDVDPEGKGAASCMEAALMDADLTPEAVGYINAHGTSTPSNDRVETLAIRKVFGSYADRLAISSTKSQLGHLLCAAGAIELLLTAVSLEAGTLPSTINLEHPDPECDLDFIAGVPRHADIRTALSNSFGFGGQNASIVLRRWEQKINVRSRLQPFTRSVVATGIGIVSPLGANRHDHYRRFLAGESAISPVSTKALRGLPIDTESHVRDFDRRTHVPHRMLCKILTSAACYAVSAAGQALQDAGVDDIRDILDHCGLWVGSLGLDQDFEVFSESLRISLDANRNFDPKLFVQYGMSLIDPLFLVRSLPNSGLCGISIQMEMKGPNLNIMNGPISGSQAIAEAVAAIRSGRIECALAGGYDSLLQLESAVSQLIDGVCVGARSLPGRTLGEGAAFVFLESEEHAFARTARVYAEIESNGQSYSAEDGVAGLENACRIAMEGSGIETASIDSVFGDGITTDESDRIEAEVLRRLGLDSSASYSSPVPALGFCGVATGAFSVAHALLSLYEGFIPRSVNGPKTGHLLNRALVWNSDRGRHHAALIARRHEAPSS